MTLAERIEELIEEIDLDGALEMIEIFLFDPKYGIDERLKNLQVSLDNKDWTSLSTEVHALKGSSSNFEAKEVIELCSLLDQYAREEEFEKAVKTFDLLKSALKMLGMELKQIKQKYV